MSQEKFLELLQCLLTMVDINDRNSIESAKAVIYNLIKLTDTTTKIDSKTYSLIRLAYKNFNSLVMYKNDFEGEPGHYEKNRMKRIRLLNMLRPGC